MNALTSMPDSFVAGTTVKLLLTFADFPAGTWSSKLYLNGASVIAPLTGTASGTNHSFNLTPTITGPLAPGGYRWQVLATSAGETYVAAEGVVEVKVNPATLGEGDGQTFEERMLVAIEARIANRNLNDLPETYQVVARMVGKVRERDLLKMRAEYRAKVDAQRNPKAFIREVRATFTGAENET